MLIEAAWLLNIPGGADYGIVVVRTVGLCFAGCYIDAISLIFVFLPARGSRKSQHLVLSLEEPSTYDSGNAVPFKNPPICTTTGLFQLAAASKEHGKLVFYLIWPRAQASKLQKETMFGRYTKRIGADQFRLIPLRGINIRFW